MALTVYSSVSAACIMPCHIIPRRSISRVRRASLSRPPRRRRGARCAAPAGSLWLQRGELQPGRARCRLVPEKGRRRARALLDARARRAVRAVPVRMEPGREPSPSMPCILISISSC